VIFSFNKIVLIYYLNHSIKLFFSLCKSRVKVLILLPESVDDRFLCSFHDGARCLVLIIVSCEVKQAVDEISEDFSDRWFSIFTGLSKGGFGADDDFAMVEGDDVCGTFDVHEIAVDLVDHRVIHESHFNRAEEFERGAGFSGMLSGEVCGLMSACFKLGEPGLGDGDPLLVISNDDVELHGGGAGEGATGEWAGSTRRNIRLA